MNRPLIIAAAAAATLLLLGFARADDVLPKGFRVCSEPAIGGRCVTTRRDVRVLPSADPGRVYLPGRAEPVFIRERSPGDERGLRPFGR